MHEVKFRLVNPGLAPRRTKLEMPRWAGEPAPRADGSHEYAWHCMPFTEGAQYGIEIFYPYDNELRVTKKNGEFVVDREFRPARTATSCALRRRGSVKHSQPLLRRGGRGLSARTARLHRATNCDDGGD